MEMDVLLLRPITALISPAVFPPQEQPVVPDQKNPKEEQLLEIWASIKN